jgi:adenosine deaminase
VTPTLEELRNYPKVSLHDHLDGGLRIETILDLADDRGIALPASTPEALRAWFDGRTTAGSLEAYLEGDAVTSAVLRDVDALVRVARESVEDLAADGVVYAELRWAPSDMLALGISMSDAVDAVSEGLRAGEVAVGGATTARQILCAMRHEPGSESVAELAVARDDVVGFDLAGPEAGYPPSLHRRAFEMLCAHGIPVTVHAGEAAGIESIREALDVGGARRVGHGIRLLDDFAADGSPGPLTERIIADGIVLEVCPSSNVHTGAVLPGEAHPFDRLYRAGVPVTVSADNRLTSRTTLSRELQSLCAAFGYTMADVATFQATAEAAAFTPCAAARQS